MGFLHRVDIDGLSPKTLSKYVSEFKQRQQNGSRESEFFHKWALGTGTEPRWDHPEIDLWLIEIWPMVDQYVWTYPDIYKPLLAKFGNDERFQDAGVLKRPKTLRDRCEWLGLPLSELARRRRGRPSRLTDGENILYGFGRNVYAQFAKAAEVNEPWVGKQGPTAFQSLAELAANIEPFTRDLDGTSKESCAAACPNLKELGGKQKGHRPPFFVCPFS